MYLDAGVRPKLCHPSLGENSTFQDFYIGDRRQHSIGGYIHLSGIESPGLTSSLAIAEYVTSIVRA